MLSVLKFIQQSIQKDTPPPKFDFYKLANQINEGKIELYTGPFHEHELPFSFTENKSKTPLPKYPNRGEYIIIRKSTTEDGFSGDPKNWIIIEKGGGDTYQYGLVNLTPTYS